VDNLVHNHHELSGQAVDKEGTYAQQNLPVYNYGTLAEVSQGIFSSRKNLSPSVENTLNYPHSSQSYPQFSCDKMSRNALIFSVTQLG
jgi:hypothetical protein